MSLLHRTASVAAAAAAALVIGCSSNASSSSNAVLKPAVVAPADTSAYPVVTAPVTVITNDAPVVEDGRCVERASAEDDVAQR